MRAFIIALLCFSFVAQTLGALTFNKVTDAPWPARSSAGVITTPVALSPDSVNLPKGSIVILGGSVAGTRSNDIWSSSDGGKNWNMISGISNGAAAPGNPYGENSFSAVTKSAFTVDKSSGRVYKLAGEGSTGSLNDVWASDNVVQWSKVSTTSVFPARFYAGATVDSTGKVILAGGYGGTPSYGDVWTSTDKGTTWSRIVGYDTSNKYSLKGCAPWGGNSNGAGSCPGGRGVFDIGSWQHPLTQEDIHFIWTGSSVNADTFDDVWISGDGGASWDALTVNAPFSARNDDIGGISSAGTLVVAAGRGAQNSSGGYDALYNDVWASLDGGFNWGRCTDAAEYPARRYASSTFDSNGYFYVMAGESEGSPTVYYNDVWVSSFSFDNAADVAAHCGLTVPSCGIGLYCSPGSEFNENNVAKCAMTFLCEEYDDVSSSNESNSEAVTALAVLFVLSFLVAAFAIYYIYRLKKNGQANYVSSGDSLGSLNDGNSLYKPLTIHS